MADSHVSDLLVSTHQEMSVSSTLSGFSDNLFPNATAARSVPAGCSVISSDNTSFVPWDHPDTMVSHEAEDMTLRIKCAVILPLLFLIGGPGNVINMAVFYKQGLRERVNLCLFALSLADGLYLLQAIFYFGDQIPLLLTTGGRYGAMTITVTNYNLVGLFGLTWVSQIISAIIASERCLCVLSPLRSQRLIKTRTMAVVLSSVFVVTVGLYFVVAARYRLGCVYDSGTGKSLVAAVDSEFYTQHSALINYLDGFLFGAGIPVLVMVVVTTTTTITATKIRQAARWRAESSASDAVRTISPRDVALTKMLIGTSLLFMVCVFPMAVFRCACLFLLEINPGRRHQNLYFTCLWILDVLNFTNSTFNIFVYYTMGSRFRRTFWELFRRQTTKKAPSLPTIDLEISK